MRSLLVPSLAVVFAVLGASGSALADVARPDDGCTCTVSDQPAPNGGLLLGLVGLAYGMRRARRASRRGQ